MFKKVDRILEFYSMPTQNDVSAKLAALAAGVARLPDIEASVQQLLANLSSQVQAVKTSLAAVDIPQAVIDQIDALTTAISVHSDKLSHDILANTPASPTPAASGAATASAAAPTTVAVPAGSVVTVQHPPGGPAPTTVTAPAGGTVTVTPTPTK